MGHIIDIRKNFKERAWEVVLDGNYRRFFYYKKDAEEFAESLRITVQQSKIALSTRYLAADFKMTWL